MGYFFIAIVVQADVVAGCFWPSYVLCQNYTTSEKRSGYQIVKQLDGIPAKRLPRVLVTETTGHEDMINFMSSYQCQDKKGKHYHPRGMLCWFECDSYGDPVGLVIPIKKVPEYVWIYDFKNKGFQRLKRERSRVPPLNEVLTRDKTVLSLDSTKIKAKLHQISRRKEKEQRRLEKNASSEENRNKE